MVGQGALGVGQVGVVARGAEQLRGQLDHVVGQAALRALPAGEHGLEVVGTVEVLAHARARSRRIGAARPRSRTSGRRCGSGRRPFRRPGCAPRGRWRRVPRRWVPACWRAGRRGRPGGRPAAPPGPGQEPPGRRQVVRIARQLGDLRERLAQAARLGDEDARDVLVVQVREHVVPPPDQVVEHLTGTGHLRVRRVDEPGERLVQVVERDPAVVEVERRLADVAATELVPQARPVGIPPTYPVPPATWHSRRPATSCSARARTCSSPVDSANVASADRTCPAVCPSSPVDSQPP